MLAIDGAFTVTLVTFSTEKPSYWVDKGGAEAFKFDLWTAVPSDETDAG